MSQADDKAHEIRELKAPIKCRIPQMQKYKPMACRSKIIQLSRPKSGNKGKNECLAKLSHQTLRRPERERFQLKRPSTLQKTSGKSSARPIITVPLDTQYQRGKCNVMNSELPTQEDITNLELESKTRDYSTDSDSPGPEHDINLLNTTWDQYSTQFEMMKKDLAERQKDVVQFYATMENTHQKMRMMGQNVALPPVDNLCLMNVAKLPVDQLLQICAVTSNHESMGKQPLEYNAKRLYGLPTKLIATCEQTLKKRKEIIDWFSSIKSNDKKISMSAFEKKIQEFNGENEMLQCSFEQAKIDFLRELNEMIDFVRETVKEAVKLQLRTEEQTHEITELNSKNNNLWKRIHCSESTKSNKVLEECQNELKEEKANNSVLLEKVSRMEGQLQIEAERANQLESALEESRTKCWAFETSIQQLNKQNQKIQEDFDKELNVLTSSIRKNTAHLEEIGIAREKLQAEKEDLEKRLGQLSQSYNEAIENSKAELTMNLTKLMEAEQKYQEKTEEADRLAAELDTVTAEVHESQRIIKDMHSVCDGYEEKIRKYEEDMQAGKMKLELAMSDLNDYRRRVDFLNDNVKLIESNMQKMLQEENVLKEAIKGKEELIAELQQKEAQQAKLLQESEEKMNSYEEQIVSLKTHVAQLKEDFGEFETLNDLRDLVNSQREQLTEVKNQNEDLIRAMQEKDRLLQEQIANITKFEKLLIKKDKEIKIITKKEEEQENIIKLLRNNMEMQSHADTDLTEQLTKNKSEIRTLIASLETRDQQISQLEKIILVLEDESRKTSMQRKKEREKINFLETQLADCEALLSEYKRDGPESSLDDIINILEEELSTSLEPNIANKPLEYYTPKNKYIEEKECESNRQILHQSDQEVVPTKITMGNLVKKSILLNNKQVKDLGRKEAIMNISHSQEIRFNAPTNIKYATVTDKEQSKKLVDIHPNDAMYLVNNKYRNLCLNSALVKDDKKSKMFKFAGHRL